MGLVYTEHFKTSTPSPISMSPPLPNSKRANHRVSSSSSSCSSSSTSSSSFSARSSISSIYNSHNTPRSSFASTNSNSHFTPSPTLSNFQLTPSSTATYYDKHNLLTTPATNPLKILRCKECHTHICLSSLIISDNFYGNSGPAFFVSKVLNIKLNPVKEFKKMRTGKYEVKLLLCVQCGENLGWKYLYSEDDKEKYKEGRFVIERNLLEEVVDE